MESKADEHSGEGKEAREDKESGGSIPENVLLEALNLLSNMALDDFMPSEHHLDTAVDPVADDMASDARAYTARCLGAFADAEIDGSEYSLDQAALHRGFVDLVEAHFERALEALGLSLPEFSSGVEAALALDGDGKRFVRAGAEEILELLDEAGRFDLWAEGMRRVLAAHRERDERQGRISDEAKCRDS